MKLSHFVTYIKGQAVFLKLLVFLLYYCNNALSKYLTSQLTHPLSVAQVLVYHYSIAGAMLLCFMLPYIGKLPSPKHYILHGYRIVVSVSGVVLLHYSFGYMSVSEAIGLQLLGPLFSLALSYYGLAERFTFERLGLIMLAIFTQLCLFEHHVSLLHQHTPLLAVMGPILVVISFQLHTYFTKQLTNLGEHPFHLAWGIFFILPFVLLPQCLYAIHSPSVYALIILCVMSINALLALFILNHVISLTNMIIFIPLGLCKYSIMCFFDYLLFLKMPSQLHTIGMLSGLVCIMLLQSITQDERRPHHLTP